MASPKVPRKVQALLDAHAKAAIARALKQNPSIREDVRIAVGLVRLAEQRIAASDTADVARMHDAVVACLERAHTALCRNAALRELLDDENIWMMLVGAVFAPILPDLADAGAFDFRLRRLWPAQESVIEWRSDRRWPSLTIAPAEKDRLAPYIDWLLTEIGRRDGVLPTPKRGRPRGRERPEVTKERIVAEYRRLLRTGHYGGKVPQHALAAELGCSERTLRDWLAYHRLPWPPVRGRK